MAALGDFYETLAPFYDGLNGDLDYSKITAFLQQAFEKEGLGRPEIFLDAGCGTGSLSLLADEFCDSVIGVDASFEMLCFAREKAFDAGKEILFLEQNLLELDLYGTVDAALCAMDTLNHLPDEESFAAALCRIALFVRPGGLLCFDLNTPYKHQEILGNHSLVKESEEAYCVWNNEYNDKDGSVEMTIDLFVGNEEDGYDRVSALQKEILISEETLQKALKEAGLTLLSATDDYSFEPLRADSQRVTYLARKN